MNDRPIDSGSVVGLLHHHAYAVSIRSSRTRFAYPADKESQYSAIGGLVAVVKGHTVLAKIVVDGASSHFWPAECRQAGAKNRVARHKARP